MRRDFLDRDTHIAKVLEEQVFAKRLKALFFAGAAHLERRRQGTGRAASPGPPTAKGPADSLGITALDRLESRHPGTVQRLLNLPEDDLFWPTAEEPYFPPPPPKR